MKNPLIKRLPRELKKDFAKYLVIFLLLILSIGFVSGYLVAEVSMMEAYRQGFARYRVEDGHFSTQARLNKSGRQEIEKASGTTIYDLLYTERTLTTGSTQRLYADRTDIDLPCIMEGRLPEKPGEVVIDRMFADNNQLSVGDQLTADATRCSPETTWTITGFVALPDYSCLFADNNDSMFDAVKFSIGLLCPEEFAAIDKGDLIWNYAWLNTPDASGLTEADEGASTSADSDLLTTPADSDLLTAPIAHLTTKSPVDLTDDEKKALNSFSEDFMKILTKNVKLTSYVPRHLSQAITFTGMDLAGDRGMMTILLYLIIAIMAFVFGVTINNTILTEAPVIGTLRASGYTRRELLRHYMTMPVIVTLISALVGNILGYTYFKYICVDMYYGSYSLPTYTTVWSGEAFIMTTLIPIAMMLVITYVMLRSKLALKPLQFIRGELSRRKKSRALYLSPKLPFMTRFGIRVLFQNMSSYIVIFIGVIFANVLLLFGTALPEVLDYYTAEVQDNMLAPYQTILQVPLDAVNEDRPLESLVNMALFESGIETDDPTAEKFSVFSEEDAPEGGRTDSVLVYGIEKDSRYVDLDLTDDDVIISSSYAEKYEIGPGSTITLTEPYDDGSYSLTVTGVYDYPGGIVVFMNRAACNRLFGEDDDFFCGFFSEEPLTDIKDAYIGSTISLDDLLRISRQLEVSMGGMMGFVNIFAVIVFIILLYLLTKLIIEKNASAISLAKILGYRNGEITRLYLMPTTLAVLLSLILSLPIDVILLKEMFKIIMVQKMTGWIPLHLNPSLYPRLFLIGAGAYFAVAAMETRRIKKVRMDEALKMRE